MIININCDEPKFNYKLNTRDQGIVAVYGVSGSGKSTLLNALSGLILNVKGKMDYKKNNLLLQHHGQKICFMSQDPILFPHWTIEQNLNFALNYSKNTDVQLNKLIKKLQCTKLLNKLPSKLSGGEKQRIALIRTLVLADIDSLILLDEPFSALDNKMRTIAIKLVEEYKARNLIFLVSHNLIDLYRISNDFIYIENNKIKHNNSTNEIMKSGFNNLPIASKINLNEAEHIIYADNVSINLYENNNSSIVYQLSSIITSIQNFKEHVILGLKLENNETLFSKITKQSFNRLALKKELTVFANFKATTS